MKTIAKVTPAILLFVSVLFIQIACNHENGVTPDPTQKGQPRLQTSQAEYQRLMSARQTASGTPFDITQVTRSGDLLTIQVKGGCAAEEYKIVWDGRILESYPQIVNLVVSNESAGSCQQAGEYSLTVDLKKLIGDNYKANDFFVKVSNGSQVKDIVADPNGAVTSK